MAILFISNVVPDKERYRNPAFTRSGNNVLTGICDSLPNDNDTVFLSCRPVPSFPKSKIWYSKEKARLDSGKEVLLIPTLNIKVIKNVFWGFYCFFYILFCRNKQALRTEGVLVYNIYTPPISFLYWACRLTKIPLYAILYDLGVPPKRLGLSWMTMLGYRLMEKRAKKYIPLLDGRIVINENIVTHYAPGKDYILIDGGLSNQIVEHLFPLEESHTQQYALLCAGMLWDQNGTKLVLDTLDKYPSLDVIVYFAGNGNDVSLIKQRAQADFRIQYCGLLDMKQLFNLYEKADILLNLRIEEDVDFHFPSKLIEYMATGKHVLSTSIAHAERDYGEYITFLDEISVDALAQKIQELINSGKHELYAKGKKAREFMLTKRMWKYRVREILQYIHRR